ncbi:enterochelin esterase [Klugiella xanthotipulae]|uniref:Enterochelin esterase family protein n=2 Tax=Klugiella xanthotipulae TaxID=244735 RepID=A0A543HHB9_9MICO|nr:enterochelin esterase family protein [Klugiella xanthotipulae]
MQGSLERDFAAADPAARRALVAALRAEPAWPLIRPIPGCAGDSGAPPQAEVTFLRCDAEATAVFLFLNRITDETQPEESEMRRLGTTDLWTRTVRMPTTWRASYAFLSHAAATAPPWRLDPAGGADHRALRALLDSGRADPRNPLRMRNRSGGPVSVVELPDAPPQPWFRAPPPTRFPRGCPPSHTLPYRGTPRALWLSVHGVHPRPAPGRCARGAPPGPLPIVVVLDGDAWCGRFGLADAVQRAVAAGHLAPLILLGVDAGDTPTRWRDLDENRADFAAFLAALLPWVSERIPDAAPRDAVLAGQSLGGRLALELLAGRLTPSAATPTAPPRHGFTAAVSLSASLWGVDTVGLLPSPGTRVSLHVGTQEWVLLADHRSLAAEWAARGIPHHYTEFTGGHDYACWRSSLIAGLRDLLPPPTRG